MPDSETPSGEAAEPTDQIVSALARLRGRRGPRPPWDQQGDGPPWGRGPRGLHGHDPHGRDVHGRGGMRGMPGWPGGPQARFGGPARLRMLEALAAASHPLSVGEIAEAVGVDQPRASRLVQQSADLGLVRREADPEDARRTRIVLTDAGSALVTGFRGQRRGAVESALADFTEAERADLARLLTKLADAWPEA